LVIDWTEANAKQLKIFHSAKLFVLYQETLMPASSFVRTYQYYPAISIPAFSMLLGFSYRGKNS
jgi:hypothetical protein